MGKPTVIRYPDDLRERPSPERLVHFTVEGLFDEFTYGIPLGNEDRITAIIAPNGSGKTLCLRLINAFFGKKWSYFTDVLFRRVEFRFRSGHLVSIEKYEAAPGEDKPAALGIRFVVKEKGGGEREWIPGVVPLRNTTRTHAPIESYLPYLTRTGPNTWTHDGTGEELTLQKIFEEYGDELPESLRRNFFSEAPVFLLNFVNAVDCHLIETQRLLILREDDEAVYRPGRRPSSTLAISRKAQTLKTIIAQSLTAYAALSQSLDRSFPRRVIAQHQVLPPENLKKQLQELDEQRENLMAAGILDTEEDDPVSLPDGPMPEAISRVLSVYADDTRDKLSSLSTLLARIQLFKELISQRFVSKIVSVNKQGFEVNYHDNKVPLEKLSSGEQHQLVLFFELLFELKENALILIDEPELSLHVAWQKKFISDLKKIIALNRFDVIRDTLSAAHRQMEQSRRRIGGGGRLVISISETMDGYDIAGEIRLERQVHKGSFLLVEGTTDVKRFHPFLDHDKCSTVTCYGKKNLVEAIVLLYEDGFPGVVGLADADFDRITNSLVEHEGLLYSISHDFDADWACENSLNKYLHEVADPAKCTSLGGAPEIGSKLRLGLKGLSVLRYLNEYQSLSFKLKTLKHESFITNMAVDLDLLIDDVFYNRSHAQKPQLKALVIAHSAQDHDLVQLTSGHDLMCALGLAMRGGLAERRPAQTWGREVEMHFRLLFGDDEFKQSPLFAKIRGWEDENIPYVILAPRLKH